MKKILLLLSLLCIPAWAQLPTLPQLLQANSTSSAGTTLAFNQNVGSGQLIYVDVNSSSATPPTMSDTLSTSYTRILSGSNCGHLYQYVGLTTTGGADTISSSASVNHFHIAAFSNATATTEGTATDSTWSSSSTTITSPSITTATGGALLLSAMCAVNSGNNGPQTPGQPIGDVTSAGGVNMQEGWEVAGTNGAYTMTHLWSGGSSHGDVSMIALQAASALAVATTNIPDFVQNVADSFTLQSVGGVGAVTWDITSGSLQAGLSLSSAGVISGTALYGPDETITFRATDSSSNTGTASLTLHVATSANTITEAQHKAGGDCSGGVAMTSNVTSGNLLLACVGNNSQRKPPAAWSDTRSTAFQVLPFSIYGAGGSPIYVYWGLLTGSGADTVTCSGTTSSQVNIFELHNVQQRYDSDAWTVSNGTTGSGTTTLTSGNMNQNVVNEIVASCAFSNSSSRTLAIQSPYTNDTRSTNGAMDGDWGYNIFSSSGTQTVSYTLDGIDNWEMLGFALRPSTGGTAPAPPASGQAQVY